MNKNENLCVIIPVHKPELSPDEIISLQASQKHLINYECFLVHPYGIDISAYTTIYSNLIPAPVKPDWLSSVKMYNKMKLSTSFYQMFANYKYMLTYELDAYIFSSNIAETNAFKFDFIGAPFFEGYWEATDDSPLVRGCNSGFSIRNIQSCLKVLKGMKKYRLHWCLYKIFLSHSSRLRLKLNELTKNKYEVFITGRFSFYFDDFHINEDVVWTEIVPQLFPNFTIADPMTALAFSFEYNLEKSLALNSNKLPLGCHAWCKHMEFWKTYINTENGL